LLGLAALNALAFTGEPMIYLIVALAIAMNLAARFWTRNRKVNTSPEDSCDLIGWLTDDQVFAHHKHVEVTADVSSIFFDTGTGGLELTGIPLAGAIALYPDLCPPGEYKQAREILQSKTTQVWNVYRRWKKSKVA